MTSRDMTNKPFNIDKRRVYEAYKAVKSNGGAAGVDRQTIEQFEADLGGNLYKIWNRMSSGTYFPPPVLAVSIPKKSGGQRILGVPTHRSHCTPAQSVFGIGAGHPPLPPA
jgi:RNA-directed DNA polymerase